MARAAKLAKVKCALCSEDVVGKVTVSPFRAYSNAEDFLVKQGILRKRRSRTDLEICTKCYSLVKNCDDLTADLSDKVDFCRDLKAGRKKHDAGAHPEFFMRAVVKSERLDLDSCQENNDQDSKEDAGVKTELRNSLSTQKPGTRTSARTAKRKVSQPDPLLPDQLDQSAYVDCVLDDDDDDDFGDTFPSFKPDSDDEDDDPTYMGEPSAKYGERWSKNDPTCTDPRQYRKLNRRGPDHYVVDGHVFEKRSVPICPDHLVFLQCNHELSDTVRCEVMGALNLKENCFYYETGMNTKSHRHRAYEPEVKAVGLKPPKQVKNIKIRKQFGKKIRRCEVCAFESQAADLFFMHNTKKHAVPDGEKCFECGRTFATDEEYADHMEMHRIQYTDAVACISCRKSVLNDCLRKHIMNTHGGAILRTHDERRAAGLDVLECALCSFFCTSSYQFKHHRVSAHPGEDAFKCDKCDECFSAYKLLWDHRNEKHVNTYPCRECGQEFPTKNALGAHRKTHTIVRPTKICPICEVVFPEAKLAQHISSQHGKSEKVRLAKPWLKRIRKCSICPHKAGRRNVLFRHNIKFHAIKGGEKCFECGLSYSTPEEFQKHMDMHREEYKDAVSCYSCRRFIHRLTIDNHIDTTHKGKILRTHEERKKAGYNVYECQLCRFFCTSMFQFDHHRVSAHPNEKIWCCSACGAHFRDLRGLRDHKNLAHGDDNYYVCADCGEKFVTRKEHLAHSQTHQPLKGKKLCPLCGALVSAAKMSDHNVVEHGFPMTRSCSICNEKVPSVNALLYHKKVKHGIKRGTRPAKKIVCEDCGKKVRHSQYTAHRIRVHGEKIELAETFPCNYCGQVFEGCYALRSHERSVHGWIYKPQSELGIECSLCHSISRERFEFKKHLQTVHGLKQVTNEDYPKFMVVPEDTINRVKDKKLKALSVEELKKEYSIIV